LRRKRAPPIRIPGVVARAQQEVKAEAANAIDSAEHQVTGALSAVKDPGWMHRLKERAVSKLPYHPQVVVRHNQLRTAERLFWRT
jgi:hypothetical protein